MQSWIELTDWLIEGVRHYAFPKSELPENVAKWLRAQTMGLNEKADKWLLEVQQKRHWPECGDKALRMLLFLRLWHASERTEGQRMRCDARLTEELAALHLRRYLCCTWYEEGLVWAEVRFLRPWPVDMLRWIEN